jgi:hypothetical protein
MAMVGFTCPSDDKPILFRECWERCRKGIHDDTLKDAIRCFPLPVLKRMALGERKPPSDFNNWLPSTTQLLNDAHYTKLMMTRDYYKSPYEMVWAIMGSAGHYFLQKDTSNQLQETFLKDDICSGTIDLYDGTAQILYDYKFLGVYKIRSLNTNFQENGQDYIKQVNRYRSLLEKEGFKVKGQILCAFARDWRRFEFDREISNIGKFTKAGTPYASPVYPCQQFEIPIEDHDNYFISQKKELSEVLLGKETHECNSMFRWANDKRCTHFCAVNQFCEYYNNIKE